MMEKLSKFTELKFTLIYSLRDLSRNYKRILSIIVTLFISLFILSSIFTIEDSLNNELKNNSRVLLGGDIEIDYNREEGNLKLINKVKEFATVARMVEFNTMISTINKDKNKSLFSRIKTVDENYPLFGKVGYEPEGAFEKLQKTENTILVNQNIFKNLNLKLNDTIKVQDKLFTVIGIVKSVPDIGGAFVFGDFALAGKQTLKTLKLDNLGSFLNYEYKVKFNKEDDPKKISKKVEELFKDEKKVQVKYHEKSDGPLKRIIDNFSQFLSLVSISAMLIAGIGIANTLLSFINQSNMSIAVKKALGFFSSDIKIVYYLQLLILLLIITTIAYSLSFVLVPIVDIYLSEGLGFNIKGNFSFFNYFKVFVVGLLVLSIFSIPTINAIDQVKASSLFRNVFQNLQFYYSKKSITLSLFLLSILIVLFTVGSARPFYSLGYFAAFFICLIIFYLLSNLLIKLFKRFKKHSNISIKISVKNITQTKSITPVTVMSLGLGITLLLTLAFVGSNFKREIAKSIPELAPDYFFIGIQNHERKIFENLIFGMDKDAILEIVPMASTGIVKINGIDPNTYIDSDNNSYWVIRNERRSSWSESILKDNPIVAGKWWDLNKPDKLQISLDSNIAKDFDIKLGDIFTLNIYGREIDGEIVNFRLVNYRDFTINFAMLLNPQFAKNIPHEYLATSKFKNLDKFDETTLLNELPSLSIIKITDYLSKVTDLLNKIFIAVTIISAVTIIIGLIVISSAIMVQGKVREFQNLIFKILGFSKREIIFSSIIEFLIIFSSIILISLFFAVVGSNFIIENIFQITWKFDLSIFLKVTVAVGLATLTLIMLTNLKYLNPKVYPLIRNQ
jgi:putative ABC transport system permease protein